jgi:hypothetical protein
MSFKRLIPLAILATISVSGAASAEDRWTGYVDHHNVPVSRQEDARHHQRQATTPQAGPTEYLPEGWPRTY